MSISTAGKSIFICMALLVSGLVSTPSLAFNKLIATDQDTTMSLYVFPQNEESDLQGDTVSAALFVHMPKGYKTYWRTPGEGGFKTTIELNSTDIINEIEILWPFPSHEEDEFLSSNVYKEKLVLPLNIHLSPTVNNTPQIEFDLVVHMGICGTLCIPGRFELNGILDLNTDAIDQSLESEYNRWYQRVPQPIGPNSPPFELVEFDQTHLKLRTNESMSIDDLFVELNDDWLFGAPKWQGGEISVPILDRPGKLIAGSAEPLIITYQLMGRYFEAQLEFQDFM